MAAFGGGARAADLPPKSFPHPDRIRYDGHCLTIDGQDVFIYSGAFHYFRTPKELWRDRFAKIKAAGFNAVETYVAWNWSERQAPTDLNDTSHIDLSDLREWMRLAHDEFGLYTIIRPGPYICAEWVNGGLPTWLWSKQPTQGFENRPWIRSADPTYLAWSAHWTNAVLPVVAAEQITRKPKGSRGVILVQIENEYDFFPGVSDADRVVHLKSLYESAKQSGIEVPVFTCVTRQTRGSRDPELSQVFDASNFYSRWNLNATGRGTRDLRKAQPNAPAMISELQGGWFAEAGGKMSEDQVGIDAAQCNGITLTAIANGATALNYYMLVGGSNFGAWGAGNMLQTYDYDAPIHETGGTTEKYAAVTAIGRFLKAHGTALGRAELVPAKIATPDVRLEVTARRDAAGQHYLFFRNAAREAYSAKCDIELDGGARVSIDHRFPANLMTVLVLPAGKTQDRDGEWACEPVSLPERPPVPAAVRVAAAVTQEDPGPTVWRAVQLGQTLIAAGVFDVGDVVYRATPVLTDQQARDYAAVRVGNDVAANRMALRVNGKLVAGNRHGQQTDFLVDGLLAAGKNTFELLYENSGGGHIGDRLNVPPGVTQYLLVGRNALGKPLVDWKVAIVKDDAQSAEVAATFDDSAWEKVVLDARSFAEWAASKQPGAMPPAYPAIAILSDKNATAVYRTTFELSDKEVAGHAVRVHFDCIDDRGEIFVNGQSVGASHDWTKPVLTDISAAVRPGQNTLAVRITNTDAVGGLTKPVTLSTGDDMLPLECELGTAMTGVAGEWSTATDLSGWTPVALDTTSPLMIKGSHLHHAGGSGRLQTWTRAEFDLPAVTPGVRVPWGAVIHAAGDGFVYLNGHELGRYYDVGPQRRFYLPEPWLKQGAGDKNVLTLNLNAAGGEPGLVGLEVAPFAEHAEKVKK